MDLTFADAGLAALCSCERLLVERWGREGFRSVARRLLELSATADLSEVEDLPGAAVRRGENNAVTIEFGRGALAIRGTIAERSPGRQRSSGAVEHGLRITGLDVNIRSHAT